MEAKMTSDMQLLSDIIGVEQTMKVIAALSGISIYVPKPDYYVICYYHEQLGGNPKKTAMHLGVSLRMVYRALEHSKEDAAQLTIYDEIARVERESGVLTQELQANG